MRGEKKDRLRRYIRCFRQFIDPFGVNIPIFNTDKQKLPGFLNIDGTHTQIIMNTGQIPRSPAAVGKKVLGVWDGCLRRTHHERMGIHKNLLLYYRAFPCRAARCFFVLPGLLRLL